MKRKLVIITEIIAPYRIPVFNALSQKKEIDLHVIFLAETDRTQRDWLVHKDDIDFSYEVLPAWSTRLSGHYFLVNWGIQRALREAAPDVILCGGYNYLASWSSLRWARKNSVEFLLWVESTSRDQRSGNHFVENLKSKFLRQCHGFVVPGQASRAYLMKYGVDAGAIFRAPNAVDNRRFAQNAEVALREENVYRSFFNLPSRYFLFCGRLVKEKGIFDLLQAYENLAPEIRRDVGLVFLGDGRGRNELQHRARQVAPGNILFAGFAQRDQLAAYYALAETFVFPTHTDPWGLVVNEAMACGLPVISSDAAGCSADLVSDGSNGFRFDAGNVGALSTAMDRLARNPALRAQMAQRSLERIALYSPEAWANGVANMLSVRTGCAA